MLKRKRYYIIVFIVLNILFYSFNYQNNYPVLELITEAENNTDIELYYILNGYNFTDETMLISSYNNEEKNVVFMLEKGIDDVMRIDFGNETNMVSLMEIRYEDNPFFIKILKPEIIKQCISELNNMGNLNLDSDGRLNFKVTGRDGYLILKNFHQSFKYMFRYMVVVEEVILVFLSLLLVNIKGLFILLMKNILIILKKAGKKGIIYYSCIVLLALLITVLFPPKGNVILTMSFVFITSEAIRFCIKYCFDYSEKTLAGFSYNNKECIILAVIIIIGCLPLLSIPFSFQDEYMSFRGYSLDGITYSYGRSIQSLINKIFTFVQYNSIYYTRWFSACFTILFTWVTYKWCLINSKRKKLSFILALLIGGGSIAIDCIAYAVIMSYMYGIFMMSMSYIIYENNIQRSKYKYICSFVFAFMALNAYQLVAPVVVLLFTIKVWYSDQSMKKNICNILKYILICLICAVTYIIYIKVFSSGLGGSASARSRGIDSALLLIDKIKWFFDFIIKQTGYRIITLISGSGILYNTRMWASNELKLGRGYETAINLIVYIIPLAAICIQTKKKRSILEGAYYLVSIPASFIIFLILQENGYLTYYAYTLIILLIFYYVEFADLLLNKVTKIQKNTHIIVVFLSLLICYNAYVYSLNGWVLVQVRSHDYVKNSLLNQMDEEKEEIYVLGTPNKWQANAYSVALTENVLIELGKDYNNYDIKNTDTDGFIGVMEEDQYLKSLENMSLEEQKEFAAYYSFSEDYRQYHLNREKVEGQNRDKLIKLMEKADLLPHDNSIIIDLSWVYKN